jgi:hypothetical protein
MQGLRKKSAANDLSDSINDILLYKRVEWIVRSENEIRSRIAAAHTPLIPSAEAHTELST